MATRSQAICDDVASGGWALPDRLNMATEVCDRWADQAPDRVAILTVDAPHNATSDVSGTTYGQLRAMADGLARHLQAKGVVRGDRVGIYRTQSAWTAAAHIAVWKLGAISIPLFTLFGSDALTMRLRDSGACAVICELENQHILHALQSNSPALRELVVPEQISLATGDFATADTSPKTRLC